MEQNREYMDRIEQLLKKQSNLILLQSVLIAILALGGIALVVMVGRLLPDLQVLMTQMESTLTDMEQITAQLAEADLKGMVDNVDQLVNSSQSAVEQAMEKLNGLDLDTLNKAIKDLASVIEPLAKFFNVFH
ncbi:MAG: hypothetical protein J6A26_02235 [Oscillospiraceae bacterium]|nr:hypothetical protein [Oscillospiraceae bacterium]